MAKEQRDYEGLPPRKYFQGKELLSKKFALSQVLTAGHPRSAARPRLISIRGDGISSSRKQNRRAALEAMRELRRYDPTRANMLFDLLMPR